MAIIVNTEKCVGCTLCLQNCPFNAITMENGKAVIGEACTACGKCIEVCPVQAITKEEAEKKDAVDITQYHGVWVVAEQREGKL